MAVSMVVLPGAARADSAADRNLAQSLFEQGRTLMAQEKYNEACPKLAESQRLDPGGGTSFNLAVCYERQGKTASSYDAYNEALAIARRDGRADREGAAREALAKLAPKLSRLAVNVKSGDIAGLEVKIDGTVLGRPAWGVATPVDPGSHEIAARAPGRRDFVKTVQVGAASQIAVDVPELSVADGATPSSTVQTGNGKRTAAFVAIGAGVVGVGIGTVFGLSAISKRKESDDGCVNGCNGPAVEAYDQGRSRARISDIGFGIGLVGLAVGGYLFFTSQDGGSKSTAAQPSNQLRVLPTMGPSTVGIDFARSF